MRTKQIIIFLFIALNSINLYPIVKNHKISGKIIFHQNKGSIYIKLFTENEYNEEKETKYVQVIDLQGNENSVYFEFNDVAEGIYAIRCFQDLNGNKKIDMGLFGPKEPYGFYLEKKHINKQPKFVDLSFVIDKDISNIKINLKEVNK